MKSRRESEGGIMNIILRSNCYCYSSILILMTIGASDWTYPAVQYGRSCDTNAYRTINTGVVDSCRVRRSFLSKLYGEREYTASSKYFITPVGTSACGMYQSAGEPIATPIIETQLSTKPTSNTPRVGVDRLSTGSVPSLCQHRASFEGLSQGSRRTQQTRVVQTAGTGCCRLGS